MCKKNLDDAGGLARSECGVIIRIRRERETERESAESAIFWGKGGEKFAADDDDDETIAVGSNPHLLPRRY